MVKEYVLWCDLCLGDGEKRAAVARYWNEDEEEWHCCARHLKLVKSIDLEYEMLSEDGE